MIEEGASIPEVAEKLPDRTYRAVEMQVSRLGLKHCGVTKNFFLPEIPAERMIEREEALRVLAGAMERLRRGGDMNQAELFRLRTITAIVRAYVSVYDSCDKYADIEERFKRLEKRVQALQKTEEVLREGTRQTGEDNRQNL